MAFLSSFDICASGMSAQRVRMDVAAENIANMNATRTESGGTYRRKEVVLESYGGSSFQSILREGSKGEGYVSLPNVDALKETVDSMSATRSYEANVTALNAIKLMAQKALEIGK